MLKILIYLVLKIYTLFLFKYDFLLEGGIKVMKLKNSYILLIAISLFLLVSIGSVCAADNTNAYEVIQANEGTADIDLTNTEDSVLGEDSSTAQEKINTTVESEDVEVSENDPVEIPVSVKDNESAVIDIVKENITIKEGNKTINFNYNNSIVNIADKLAVGKHSLIIDYLGNDVYKNSTKDIIVSIYGNLTIQVNASSLDINSTKKGEIKVNVTNGVNNTPFTKEDISLNATVKSGNNTTVINIKNFEIVNGAIVFELENGDFTTADLTITYKNELSKSVTLNRIFNVIVEPTNTKNEYQNGAFTFKLTDVDDGAISLEGKELSLTTIGNIMAGFSAKADKNNTVSFKTVNLYEFDNYNSSLSMIPFYVGNHTVNIKTTGNVKSTPINNLNLTVTQANIKIVIAPFKEEYQTDKNVTITVTNKNNGEAVPGIVLHLNMPQTSGKDYYFQTDSKGQSKISVKQLVGGTYDISVSNNDTKNIKKVNVSSQIVITPKPVVITKIGSNTIWYNTGYSAVYKVVDKKTGKAVPGAIVVIQIDGDVNKTYLYQASNKGYVIIQADLAVGKHKIVVQTADTRYEGAALTKTIKVIKDTAIIKAPKVTVYYNGGKYFTMTLLNAKNNKPIFNAKLAFRIVTSTGYSTYSGTTGLNGQLRLSLDGIAPGPYKVLVYGNDAKNYAAKKVSSKFTIVKAPTKIYAPKLTAKKGDNQYFKVTVKNSKTKTPIAKVKVKVKIKVGKIYKTYTLKTNAKGIAYLSTAKFKVGTYKIIVQSANAYCVAKAVASSVTITK